MPSDMEAASADVRDFLPYGQLGADTPGEIVTDLRRLPCFSFFLDDLIRGARARQRLMLQRQERINAACRKIQHKTVEGLGEHIATIDMEVYFQQMQLHGEECWSDPKFIEEFLRDNPDVRIKSEYGTRGQKLSSTIVHPGFPTQDAQCPSNANNGASAAKCADACPPTRPASRVPCEERVKGNALCGAPAVAMRMNGKLLCALHRSEYEKKWGVTLNPIQNEETAEAHTDLTEPQPGAIECASPKP